MTRSTLVCLFIASASCRYNDMQDMPRTKPYKGTSVFPDGTTAQLPPSGTVARGSLHDPEPPNLATVTPEVIERGKGRFQIFCKPCHGPLGLGDGSVARRGFFPNPVANLQQPRLTAVAPSYIFGVITNGFNTMPPYGSVLTPSDRWAVIAYLRTSLQKGGKQ